MQAKEFNYLERIGLFCLPVASPEDAGSATLALDKVIEDVQLADAEGLGFAWIAEHHGISYGGCVPDPLTFIAAVGQRISRIALGSCMTLAPLRPPMLLAQQAQMVSRLIPSPLHLGLGKGFLPSDVLDFGLSHSEANAKFWAAVEALAALREDPQWVKDIWVASTSQEGAETVGRLGLGLALNPYTRTEAEIDASIAAYRGQIEKTGRHGAYRVLIHLPLYLAGSSEVAAREGSEHFGEYLASLKAGERSSANATEAKHTLGNADYASRCAFLDVPSFSERLVEWKKRGATHWCFLVRFGHLDDAAIRATITRCAEAAVLANQLP